MAHWLQLAIQCVLFACVNFETANEQNENFIHTTPNTTFIKAQNKINIRKANKPINITWRAGSSTYIWDSPRFGWESSQCEEYQIQKSYYLSQFRRVSTVVHLETWFRSSTIKTRMALNKSFKQGKKGHNRGRLSKMTSTGDRLVKFPDVLAT